MRRNSAILTSCHSHKATKAERCCHGVKQLYFWLRPVSVWYPDDPPTASLASSIRLACVLRRSGGAGGDGDGDSDCGGDGDGVCLPRSSLGSGDGALTTVVTPSGIVLSWTWVFWVSSTSV